MLQIGYSPPLFTKSFAVSSLPYKQLFVYQSFYIHWTIWYSCCKVTPF